MSLTIVNKRCPEETNSRLCIQADTEEYHEPVPEAGGSVK